MHYRLRASVKYVIHNNDVIFRLGDSYLPMSCPSALPWMGDLLQLLREPSSMEEIRNVACAAHHKQVDRMFRALSDAGMLCEAEAASSLRYTEEESRLLGAVTRGERACASPVVTFRRARYANTLVVGRGDMAARIAALAGQSGCLNLTVAALRSLPFEDSGKVPATIIMVDEIDSEALMTAIRRCESMIIACDSSPGDASMVLAIADLIDRERLTRAHLLVANQEFVALGTLWRPGVFACPKCASRSFFFSAATDERAGFVALSPGFEIAACIAVQRLWDTTTELTDPDDDFMVTKVPNQSPLISRHVQRVTCGAACNGKQQLRSNERGGKLEESQAFSAEQFLNRAGRLLIDVETGVIEQLDEYDLLQFPLHQSAVKVRLPWDRSTGSAWMVESGEDIFAARTSAMRSGAELYLLRENGQIHKPGPEGATSWETVVSSLSYASGLADGLGRTFAACANMQPHWAAWCWPELQESDTASLFRAYLEDVHRWDDIVIEQYTASQNDTLKVVRFVYRGAVVSVVAGLAQDEVLAIGLSDVRTQIGWQESSIAAGANLEIPLFRSDSKLRLLSEDQLQRIMLELGVKLTHTALLGAVTHFAQPFSFTLVSLSLSAGATPLPGETIHASRTL